MAVSTLLAEKRRARFMLVFVPGMKAHVPCLPFELLMNPPTNDLTVNGWGGPSVCQHTLPSLDGGVTLGQPKETAQRHDQ